MSKNEINRYTCKNSAPHAIANIMAANLARYFTRNEYKNTAEFLLAEKHTSVPTLATLLNNDFVYPVAYEAYWIQNEYGEAVECVKYFYCFNYEKN